MRKMYVTLNAGKRTLLVGEKLAVWATVIISSGVLELAQTGLGEPITPFSLPISACDFEMVA